MLRRETWERVGLTSPPQSNIRARFGIIALATDRVGVSDFEAFLSSVAGLEIFSTRVPMGPVATPETLFAIKAGLRSSAELLVPGSPLNVVAFSCTSGSVAIGTKEVASAIHEARPGVRVSTPIEGGVRGLRAVNAARISLLVPYREETANLVAGYFEDAGLTIDRRATLDLDGDIQMNAVDERSLFDSACKVMGARSEALFISCTGLRTARVVSRIEERIGRPVLTSNQVLAWDCLRLAGLSDQLQGRGRLFSVH
jgi:maleate isomerase